MIEKIVFFRPRYKFLAEKVDISSPSAFRERQLKGLSCVRVLKVKV